MGLFSKFFGGNFSPPPREKWDGIIEDIHSQLAQARPVFFDACVNLLSVLPEVTIQNRQLTQRIELAITVYQLHLGRELIAAHEYIPPEEGKSFITSLYSQACRYGSSNEVDECIRRYWPREDEAQKGMEIFCFCSDIATHITGNETPAIESMQLAESIILRLTIISRLAVAVAFGDRKTVKELQKGLKKLNK